jgi:cob(I)alamin adenosyltransferase
MTKIYTRTGDDGETSLLGGERVRKNDLRIEAIGSVDETNAAIGLVRAELDREAKPPDDVDAVLATVQHELFNLGAELAARASAAPKIRVSDADVRALESAIDKFEAGLEPLRVFILPGGRPAAAQLHSARCICRRAERRVVELASAEPIRCELVKYLNRLSDLLFVLARAVNKASGILDVEWQKPKEDGA